MDSPNISINGTISGSIFILTNLGTVDESVMKYFDDGFVEILPDKVDEKLRLLIRGRKDFA